MKLIDPGTEEEYGPDFVDIDELIAFVEWHRTGEDRSLIETYAHGHLENQVIWWRNGGHLIEH